MTGTADTEAEEFKKIYELEVVVVPTNEPIARLDHADLIYATKQGKYKAVSELIRECNQRKQPVLVGTISIESSEILSKYLKPIRNQARSSQRQTTPKRSNYCCQCWTTWRCDHCHQYGRPRY